jgi:hypothetical protein
MDKFSYGKLHKIVIEKETYYFRSFTLNEIKFIIRIGPDKVKAEPGILIDLACRCIVLPANLTENHFKGVVATLPYTIFNELFDEVNFLYDTKSFEAIVRQYRSEVAEGSELFTNYISVLCDVFGYSPSDVSDMSVNDVIKQVAMAERIVKDDLFYIGNKKPGARGRQNARNLQQMAQASLTPLQQQALSQAEDALSSALRRDKVKYNKKKK